METLEGTRASIQDIWHQHKQNYWNKVHVPCPPGWTRHRIEDPSAIPPWQTTNQPKPDATPLCFYTHTSEPDSEFWYPLPLPQETESAIPHVIARYITCRTRRGWLQLGEELFHNLRRQGHMMSLRDRAGNWAGALRLCEPLPSTNMEDGAGVGDTQREVATLELVEIARGSMRNDARDFERLLSELEEWDLDERPRSGELYEYYYVLWVERREGVVYRKAIGRVCRDAWESQERE